MRVGGLQLSPRTLLHERKAALPGHLLKEKVLELGRCARLTWCANFEQHWVVDFGEGLLPPCALT